MCFSGILQVDKLKFFIKDYEINSWLAILRRIQIVSSTGLSNVHCIFYPSGYFDTTAVGLGFQILFRNILTTFDNSLSLRYIYYS
jgi:hypothetical protein